MHVAFSDGVSGSSRYLCDLARRQIDVGHQLSVALPPRGRGGSIYESLPASMEVFSGLGSPGWVGMARAIRAFRPEVIHCHDGRGPRALRWIFNRPPTVATLHLGYKTSMDHADGLVRIARWQDVGRFRGPVIDVPNWRIAGPKVTPEQVAVLRRGLGVGEDRLVIGCVGRLIASKGADIVIEAFQRTAAPQAVLVFLGEGPKRAALEAKAAGDQRIRFLGLRSDIDAWYEAFDAFVSPSYSEHSPLVVLEAMAAGVPIAAAANPGSAEMLDCQPAQMFPCGDAAALAAILSGWIAAAPARVRYDLSRFDPDRAQAAINDLYARLLADPR